MANHIKSTTEMLQGIRLELQRLALAAPDNSAHYLKACDQVANTLGEIRNMAYSDCGKNEGYGHGAGQGRR